MRYRYGEWCESDSLILSHQQKFIVHMLSLTLVGTRCGPITIPELQIWLVLSSDMETCKSFAPSAVGVHPELFSRRKYLCKVAAMQQRQ